MSKNNDQNVAMQLVNGIVSHGVDGVGPLSGSKDLAQQYRADLRFKSDEDRIDALIRWEAGKSFGTGFLTGLGGLITLPISVPSGLYASWVVQARLVGAIAELRGWSTGDDRVRTLILLCLLGNEGKQILKEVGEEAGKALTVAMIKRLPGRVLRDINRKVGFRLVSKGGEKSLITLTKVVPIVGGVIGGTVDYSATRVVGGVAKTTLPRNSDIPGSFGSQSEAA